MKCLNNKWSSHRAAELISMLEVAAVAVKLKCLIEKLEYRASTDVGTARLFVC
jgi:hypothetical protein